MSDGEVKLGRKLAGDDSGEMERVTFRMDAETKADLDRLVREDGLDTVRGGVSIVLRRLIRAAAKELAD